MEICCFPPPYGFDKNRHVLPSLPNVVMTDVGLLDDMFNTPYFEYPTGPGLFSFQSRMSNLEWEYLKSDVKTKLKSAWATGAPLRYTACSYNDCIKFYCFPVYIVSMLLCFALRDDFFETAKTGRQLNVMYDVLARYNATHFNPRLMNARLYVKEDYKTYSFLAGGGERTAPTLQNCTYYGHTLVVAIHIASTEEEFLALPRPVVGVDAGYPEAIGNCCCFACPKGGVCCIYPRLDHQLDGPRSPLPASSPSAITPAVPAALQGQYLPTPPAAAAAATGQYALIPTVQTYSAPVGSQAAQGAAVAIALAPVGTVYTPPATVQMIDHRAPPAVQQMEKR